LRELLAVDILVYRGVPPGFGYGYGLAALRRILEATQRTPSVFHCPRCKPAPTNPRHVSRICGFCDVEQRKDEGKQASIRTAYRP